MFFQGQQCCRRGERAPIYRLSLHAWGVGRRLGGFTRVFGEMGTREEELAILRARFWLRSW